MPEMQSNTAAKEAVRDFWNADPCGSRYLECMRDLSAHAPPGTFIFDFADFHSWRGLKVLEVGVGMGADYREWLKAGAHATGVDLSLASIENARLRCEAAGFNPDLRCRCRAFAVFRRLF